MRIRRKHCVGYGRRDTQRDELVASAGTGMPDRGKRVTKDEESWYGVDKRPWWCQNLHGEDVPSRLRFNRVDLLVAVFSRLCLQPHSLPWISSWMHDLFLGRWIGRKGNRLRPSRSEWHQECLLPTGSYRGKITHQSGSISHALGRDVPDQNMEGKTHCVTYDRGRARQSPYLAVATYLVRVEPIANRPTALVIDTSSGLRASVSVM